MGVDGAPGVSVSHVVASVLVARWASSAAIAAVSDAASLHRGHEMKWIRNRRNHTRR